jgi:hypothetical protein
LSRPTAPPFTKGNVEYYCSLRVLTFPLVSAHVLNHHIAGTGMTEGFVDHVDIIGGWLHENGGWVCIFVSWAA